MIGFGATAIKVFRIPFLAFRCLADLERFTVLFAFSPFRLFAFESMLTEVDEISLLEAVSPELMDHLD